MTGQFKVYIIKCIKSNKCYISYTDSDNKSYNPVLYLNNVYKKDKTRYIALGESVEEYGLKEHKYEFIKENLSKEQAVSITEKLREKTKDRTLHDHLVKKSYFDEELALLNDEDIND